MGPSVRLENSEPAVVGSFGLVKRFVPVCKRSQNSEPAVARSLRVLFPLSPPVSLNCRESPQPVTPKHAKHAHCSRSLLNNMDWRERTARRRRGPFRLFSGGQIRSPVSRRASGECNAIKNRGFGHCELTFVSSLEASFGARHKAARDVSFGVERTSLMRFESRLLLLSRSCECAC